MSAKYIWLIACSADILWDGLQTRSLCNRSLIFVVDLGTTLIFTLKTKILIDFVFYVTILTNLYKCHIRLIHGHWFIVR